MSAQTEQRLSAAIHELVELKREMLTTEPIPPPDGADGMAELSALAERIGAAWRGADAVAEIRSQREKG